MDIFLFFLPFTHLISRCSLFIFTGVKTGKRNAFQLFSFVHNSATTRGTDGKCPMQYISSEWLFTGCVFCLELFLKLIFSYIQFSLEINTHAQAHFFLRSRLTKMQLTRHLWLIKAFYLVHSSLMSFCLPSAEQRHRITESLGLEAWGYLDTILSNLLAQAGLPGPGCPGLYPDDFEYL